MSPGGESGPGSHHIASNELLTGARPGQAELQIWSSLAKFPASVLVGEGSGGQNGIIVGQALTWSIEVVRAVLLITLITHQDKILTLSGGAICGPIKHHLQLECACYSTWRS